MIFYFGSQKTKLLKNRTRIDQVMTFQKLIFFVIAQAEPN